MDRAVPPRRRRSFTNVGGPVDRGGDAGVARELARALDVRPAPEPDRWTHGFHTYPARMHPDTAARLVAAFSDSGEVVLDPFCGSGTVLVEAMVGGRRAVGRDLNPLAVRIARLRTTVIPAAARRALRERARAVAGRALERSRGGRPPPGPPRPDPRPFDARAYVELRRLLAAVESERHAALREALLLVLSSLLVKASARVSDTDRRTHPVGRPPGALCRMFALKASELAGRLAALAEAVPDGIPPPDIAVDDARRLDTVRPDSVDLVVTSPPYPNVYDYHDHHDIRFEWLGIDAGALLRGEIGARRSFRDPGRGLAAWERDGQAWMRALAGRLRPGRLACVLIGDGATSLGPIRAAEAARGWAREAGMETIAWASQGRPAFDPQTRNAWRGDRRREHLLALRRPRA